MLVAEEREDSVNWEVVTKSTEHACIWEWLPQSLLSGEHVFRPLCTALSMTTTLTNITTVIHCHDLWSK